jgi:hypothetical protein
MTPSNHTRTIGYILVFILISLVIVLIWSRVPVAVRWWNPQLQPPRHAGEFGDQFGIASALFSGLAFAGVFIAVIMQARDLALTQKELRRTGEVLELQHATLQEQTRAVSKQAFESTFFALLRLREDIVDGLARRHRGGSTDEGRGYFARVVEKLNRRLDELGPTSRLRDETQMELARAMATFQIGQSNRADWSAYIKVREHHIDEIKARAKYLGEVYEHEYQAGWASELGHYFRHSYQIFRFIDESNSADKTFYGRVARAQFSDLELIVLFYNCLSRPGFNFVRYAEKYHLFDNLDPGVLQDAGDQYLVKSKFAAGPGLNPLAVWM